MKIILPTELATLESHAMRQVGDTAALTALPPFNRIAYAAAHVVIDPRRLTILPARRRRSTGMRHWPFAAICMAWASRWPKRWIRRSAAWA